MRLYEMCLSTSGKVFLHKWENGKTRKDNQADCMWREICLLLPNL
ncbi:hypothetical protein C1A50_3179 [Paenibacillus polymyxa]|nr:hypothetical protein C1A50_3179 [Paenibacillus polymyxa]